MHAQVVPGQTSETFRRHPLPHAARASFSLVYCDAEGAARTLDLTARSEADFELWLWGLQVHLLPRNSFMMGALCCSFVIEHPATCLTVRVTVHSMKYKQFQPRSPRSVL